MRGQFLVVRPAVADDTAAIQALRLPTGPDAPGAGEIRLVAKLIGDLAGVIAGSETAGRLELRTLYVVPRLRRKRIGRALLDAFSHAAAERGLPQISAAEGCTIAGYLEKRGFVPAPPLLTRTAMGETRR